MTVYPYPSPQGIFQNGDTLFANAGAVSYQWYQDGTLVPGATDYFYVATISGNYNVVATDNNGCEVEAVIFDVIASTTPLSLGEGSGVRLFPNPVTDKIEIKNLAAGKRIAASVYNQSGEKILELNKITTAENLFFDVTPLASGFYYLQLSSDKNIYHSRFIKQ